MSRCAGAGREHSQAASPSWPMEMFHTMGIMLSLRIRVGQRGGIFSFLSISVSSNFLLSRSLNFSSRSIFLVSFVKFEKFWEFYDCCSGSDCESVIGWWENCVLYSLFCIFIIISSSSSSNSSVSFVVLLNCLYLNPWILLFVDFSSPSCWGEGEEWASVCLVPSCQLLS